MARKRKRSVPADKRGRNGKDGSGNKRPPSEHAVPSEEKPSDASAAGYLLDAPCYRLTHKDLQKVSAPLVICRRRWISEIPHIAVVFLLVAGLYAYTTPRFVTFEDDGLFLMNMHYFGVAHPPGYPLHTILGGLFYHVFPFGSPAFKGHFFSGVAGALSCCGVYAATALLTRGRLPAYGAGLAYGSSLTFWSQAIIAEVYTLNTMMFFLVLALVIAYSSYSGRLDSNRHRALMWTVAFSFGLGLTNHWPLLGLGSVGFGLLVLSQLRHILFGLPLASVFLGIGLLPYLWMVLRSRADVPVSFYGAIGSLQDFFFYVRRSGYSGVDNQHGVGIEEKFKFAEFLGDQMLWQFTPIGAALVLIGMYAMFRSCHLWVFVSLFISWFMSSFFLVMVVNFQAEYIWLAAFRVYPLVAYGIMAIWLGYGIAWLSSKLPLLRTHLHRAFLAMVAAASTVGASVYAHWDFNHRGEYRWAHDFSMFKLKSLEPNTEYFTFDDLDVPVGYLHYVENVRPDVNIYNDQGLVFGNRLYSPLMPDSEKKKAIMHYIRYINGEKPIYYHPLRTQLFKSPEHGSDLLGFFRRVNVDGAEDRIVLDEDLRLWLLNASEPDDSITDLWTRHQRYTITATLAHTLLLAGAAGYQYDELWQESINTAINRNLLARVSSGMTKLQHNQMSIETVESEYKWTRTSKDMIYADPHLDGKGRAHFHIYRGILASFLKNTEDFEVQMLVALEENPEQNNPAFSFLLDYYAANNRKAEYVTLVDRHVKDWGLLPAKIKRSTEQYRKDIAAPTH